MVNTELERQRYKCKCDSWTSQENLRSNYRHQIRSVCEVPAIIPDMRRFHRTAFMIETMLSVKGSLIATSYLNHFQMSFCLPLAFRRLELVLQLQLLQTSRAEIIQRTTTRSRSIAFDYILMLITPSNQQQSRCSKNSYLTKPVQPVNPVHHSHNHP